MTLRTFNTVVAALGGEGGGVLVAWITEAARREGWFVQSTSVPGVAQRTGATIYYIEMFPRDGHAEAPVMSLFPMSGDVDLIIASELAEAGRMASRGLVTPDRTMVVTSSHRVYSVGEKSAPGDGRVDGAAIHEVLGLRSRGLYCLDLNGIADKRGTPISAALLGALAGSGVLPLNPDTLEHVLRDGGARTCRSLAVFSEARRATREPAAPQDMPKPNHAVAGTDEFECGRPVATTAGGARLLERLRSEFPKAAHPMLLEGLVRLVDYQDFRYAQQYLDRLLPLVDRDDATAGFPLVNEAGRYLALWMAHEDIVRVAQIKTRRGRMEEVRVEVRATPDQPMRVTEYFAPRLEEFCAIMPAWLAVRVLSSRTCHRLLAPLSAGLLLRTDALGPFLLLRLLASLRPIRRWTWGHREESRRIEAWLGKILQASDHALSLEIALCGRLVKGYGDTRRRGFEKLDDILVNPLKAEQIRLSREKALADA